LDLCERYLRGDNAENGHMIKRKPTQLLKQIESIYLDERMAAIAGLVMIGSSVVPALLEIAGNHSKRVEYRKSAIYALGQIGDKRAENLLLQIINGFWAGSAEKREIARIEENLTKDEHFGLAREAKAALVEMGYRVEIASMNS
jgi:HEAT repeat protein